MIQTMQLILNSMMQPYPAERDQRNIKESLPHMRNQFDRSNTHSDDKTIKFIMNAIRNH